MAEMGFPRPRVARAVQKLGTDHKKVEHCSRITCGKDLWKVVNLLSLLFYFRDPCIFHIIDFYSYIYFYLLFFYIKFQCKMFVLLFSAYWGSSGVAKSPGCWRRWIQSRTCFLPLYGGLAKNERPFGSSKTGNLVKSFWFHCSSAGAISRKKEEVE